MNYSKQVRDYIKSVGHKFNTEAELISSIDEMIADLQTESILNKHQISFYKQMRRELMTRDEAVAILEKSFGRELSYPNQNADWGGIPVWSVMGSNYAGYFIADNRTIDGDKTFSFIKKVCINKKLGFDETTIIETLPYNKVERLIKFVKYFLKSLDK